MELTCKTSRASRLLAQLPVAGAYWVLWLCWLSMTGLLALAPWVLAAGAASFGICLLPGKSKKWMALGLGALLLLLGLFFLKPIGRSLASLANEVFAASESRQAYEYDYFPGGQGTALWGLLFLLGWTALGAGLWKRWLLLPLTLVSMGAMAYFGITPAPAWMGLLLFSLGWLCLPGEGGWKFVLPLALSAALLTATLGEISPNPKISAGEEGVRDALALRTVTYQSTQEPEPQPKPLPSEETPEFPHQPEGDSPKVNVLFFLLAALTLLLLFVPAVIQDRARKCRERQRADFRSEDVALAIRAMYLHGKRWERLTGEMFSCPQAIYKIWQEAAYSDHLMTENQRETMKNYLEEYEQKIWEKSNKITRFRLKYKYAF